MKHYIIWNYSREWDDIYGESEDIIEYISFNLEDALNYFNKTFGDTPKLPNDKWRYEYALCEYENGYTRLMPDSSKKIKEIKRVTND